MEIKTGLKHSQSIVVTKELTAAHIGSGLVEVFATPMMIALMENTAAQCVAPYLEEGQATVGVLVNVTHSAATPLNMKVTCECELTAIDRRKLTFKVAASDEKGLIGEGVHERFIIDKEKFMSKLKS